MLCGIGLCVGYALLGACWLVRKCEGDAPRARLRPDPVPVDRLLVFLLVVFAYALVEHLPVMNRWMERPLSLRLSGDRSRSPRSRSRSSLTHRRDAAPFPMVAVIFVAAFGTLAISFWPYMIPFTL